MYNSIHSFTQNHLNGKRIRYFIMFTLGFFKEIFSICYCNNFFFHFCLVSTTARRPTDKELVLVSKHIGAGYQLLGVYLGVKNTQMEQIRINHSSCIQTQIFKMLVLWRNHNDNQAHIGNLLFAIRETCSDVNILEIEQIFHL